MKRRQGTWNPALNSSDLLRSRLAAGPLVSGSDLGDSRLPTCPVLDKNKSAENRAPLSAGLAKPLGKEAVRFCKGLGTLALDTLIFFSPSLSRWIGLGRNNRLVHSRPFSHLKHVMPVGAQDNHSPTQDPSKLKLSITRVSLAQTESSRSSIQSSSEAQICAIQREEWS